MANGMYNRGLFRLGDFDWEADSKSAGAMLVKNTYTFDKTHNKVADVVAHEATNISGSGYVRLSANAGTRTTSTTGATVRLRFGAIAWTAINAGTDLRLILFSINGSNINDDANNDLFCYYDTSAFVHPVSPANRWPAFPLHTNGGNITISALLSPTAANQGHIIFT